MILPNFSRIEIGHADKTDLITAAGHLRKLAEELHDLGTSARSDDDAVIVARHRIRETSGLLRPRSQPTVDL